MKQIIAYFSFLLIIEGMLASCSVTHKESSISGIFRIESKSMKNPLIDTFYADQNQVKIYTDEFYAYTNLKEDSTASFGVGFYETNGGQLLEHNMYSTSSLDTPYIFKLKIEKSNEGYKQTIDQMKINGLPTKLVEQYVSIPAVGTSPLDGIWKLNRYCKVMGSDSLFENRVQYKIFHKGYFMFVQDMHGNADSGNLRSGFGFGHFDFKKNQITETNLFSTYPSIIDKQVTLEVFFDGDDAFYQILPSDIENNKAIEFYTRIKSVKNNPQ